MPSKKHIHTYIRRTGNEKYPYQATFKCADAHCSHFDMAINVKGKASRCSVCGKNEIRMTYEQMRLARPRCDECSNSKDAKSRRLDPVDEAAEIVERSRAGAPRTWAVILKDLEQTVRRASASGDEILPDTSPKRRPCSSSS